LFAFILFLKQNIYLCDCFIMISRKIIHIDMDAFFASIEQRDNPELRGKPVAVGGSELRGVVAAASYEARKFGVRSAMPSVTAKRLCPDLIFTRGRFDAYRAVSNQIRTIFLEYTDLVEPLSLDEAYLDVTNNHKNIASATMIAQEIRQKIFETTQLTASAGVSFNKFIAKVASDVNKPNGITVIRPHEAEAFLNKLPIEKFYGIGKVTAKKMKNMGVHSGEDLKKVSKIDLQRKFGKAGAWYFHIVRGEDDRAVNPHRIRKSIGSEETFSIDLDNLEDMKAALIPLAEDILKYATKSENFGKTLTLKLKTPDFQTFTRSKTVSKELKKIDEILILANELLVSGLEVTEGKVRLLGLSFSHLTKQEVQTNGNSGVQLELDF
jgi:DNA polymerase-4